MGISTIHTLEDTLPKASYSFRNFIYLTNISKHLSKIIFCFLICTLSFLKSIAQAELPTNKNDSVKQHYYSFKIFTNAGILFTKQNSKIFNLSFPYSSTNSNGQISNSTFSERNKNIYSQTRIFLIPIFVEVGSRKHFVNIGNYFTFSDSYLGTSFSGGFGKIININNSKSKTDRSYIIKISLNGAYNSDYGFNNLAMLGQINNENETINFLGNTAGTSFNVVVNRNGSYQTYQSKNLNIIFKQTEIALLPIISIENNPFKHWLHFEISLGYNLPIYDNGNLNFKQDDGQGHSAAVGKSIGLNNPAISASYDNKVITSTPFHFSGFVVSFGMNFGHSFNFK